MRTRLPDLVKGLLATVALCALLAGIPAALITAVGGPLPTALPSIDTVLAAVRYGQVADATLVKLLAVIVWVAWLQLTVSVLVEAAALVRGRPARRLPGTGAMQLAAARLVSSALLIVSALGPRPALASVTSASASTWSPAVSAMADGQLVSDPLGSPLVLNPDQERLATADEAAPAVPLYEVQRGDTLWDLAERTLGDGYRWTEIRDLNVGRPQPDGETLTPASELIRRGWRLALPGNPGTRVTVEPGDSLSAIAERVYGDPQAYPTLFDANRGRLQPDGTTLTDPDLLRPGWRLDVPDLSPVPSLPGGPPSGPGHTSPRMPWTPAAPADPVVPSVPEPTSFPSIPSAEIPEGAEPELLPDEQSSSPAQVLAPTPAEPTTTPTTPAAIEPIERRGGPDDDVGAPLSPSQVASITALAAASLVWSLKRLRGHQLRRRRPGRDLPAPTPQLAEVDRQLRAAAADAPLEWVDATLRLLTVRLADAAAPSLLCVRAGALGVEVLLAQPTPSPESFTTGDDGYTWLVDPQLTLAEVQEAGEEAAPIVPALVSLGDTPEGPLLVNLEYLPVLGVEGPEAQVQAFLSGVAVELTTAPWATSVTVHTVVNPEDPLARLPGIETAPDLDELSQWLPKLALANRAATGTSENPLAARLVPDAEEWPPTVVVVRDPAAHTPQQLTELQQAARLAGGGIVLVGAGGLDGTTWRLLLDDDGSATLDPLGLRIAAVAGLDDVAAAAELLNLAVAEDIARPTPLHPKQGAFDADDGPDHEAPPPPNQMPIEICVLGTVTAAGWEAGAARPKSLELLAYLAVQDRPVTTQRLRSAVWPDGIKDSSFKSSVSRTRAMLGVDAAGAFHLPQARDGRYRLGPAVGCDWTRFQVLIEQARFGDAPLAMARLRAALALVSGPPFDGAASGAYQWAYSDQIVSAIEVAVVDAACRLAEFALDTNDIDLALWSVQQGHLVTPGHEGLYRARMRAHAHLGDLDAVHQTFREAQRAARTIDPLDEVQPETQQLHQELNHRPPAARGA